MQDLLLWAVGPALAALGLGWAVYRYLDGQRQRDVARLWAELGKLKTKVATMEAQAITYAHLEAFAERLERSWHEDMAQLRSDVREVRQRIDGLHNGRRRNREQGS